MQIISSRLIRQQLQKYIQKNLKKKKKRKEIERVNKANGEIVEGFLPFTFLLLLCQVFFLYSRFHVAFTLITDIGIVFPRSDSRRSQQQQPIIKHFLGKWVNEGSGPKSDIYLTVWKIWKKKKKNKKKRQIAKENWRE